MSIFTPDGSGSHWVSKMFARSKPMSKALVLVAFLIVSSCLLTGCNWFKPGNGLFGQHGSTPQDVVAVFFSKYQGNHSIVEAVSRPVPEPDRDAPLQFALNELLKGPNQEEKSQGFYTEIPAGTQLLSVAQKGETVTVNLSKQFTTGGGSTSITQRLEEVKQTTYAADSEHKLAIEVEGKPLETLGGEGLEVPETVKREQQ